MNSPEDRQPETDETHTGNDAPQVGEETPTPAKKEVVAKSDAKDAKKEPPKKKRLASGREAAAAVSGSLGDYGGVATHRIVHDEDASAPVAAPVGEVVEGEEFDPASDLPMYRPGMDWFVLRVASNKESMVRENPASQGADRGDGSTWWAGSWFPLRRLVLSRAATSASPKPSSIRVMSSLKWPWRRMAAFHRTSFS